MGRVHLARAPRGRPRLQGSRWSRRERCLHPLGDLLIAEPAVAARVAECTIGGGVPCVEPLRGGGPQTFGREVERRSEVERFEMRRKEQPHTHDGSAHYCPSKNARPMASRDREGHFFATIPARH